MEMLGNFKVKMLNGSIIEQTVYIDEKKDTFIRGYSGVFMEVMQNKTGKGNFDYDQM